MSMEAYVTRAEACFKAVRPGFKHGRDAVYDPFEGSVLKKLRQCIEAKASLDERTVLTQPVDRELVGRVAALEKEAKTLAEQLKSRRDAVAAAAVSQLEQDFAEQDAQHNDDTQTAEDHQSGVKTEGATESKTLSDETLAKQTEESPEERQKLALVRQLLAENAALRGSLAEMLPTVSERLKDTIRAVAEGKATHESEVDRIMKRAGSSSSSSMSNSSQGQGPATTAPNQTHMQTQGHGVNAAVLLARKVAAALKQPTAAKAIVAKSAASVETSQTLQAKPSTTTKRARQTAAKPMTPRTTRQSVSREAGEALAMRSADSSATGSSSEGVLAARPHAETNLRTPPPASPTPAVWKVAYTSEKGSARKRSMESASKRSASARKTPQRSSKTTKQTPRSARKPRTPCLRV
ncbi:Hypothetical Protein FCC1311_061662 [Hondaea fermentalgiana]|uniref:Uncharacterized protein n=1 Tax=Hondaea fermentalgiana TaxID=2315210 RepID=A0A2R5GGB1_9STRA|nr:Hypothetical Protein FCC1311_061662 [Hondaea fermentalgiana]|eukprot:GBG29946.1 Hypothetical Protein FCC1311_061662 [Hondaea fermentalgiana]